MSIQKSKIMMRTTHKILASKGDFTIGTATAKVVLVEWETNGTIHYTTNILMTLKGKEAFRATHSFIKHKDAMNDYCLRNGVL